MIIKGGPIQTSAGHKNTAIHIFQGPKNEAITPLQGNPSIMEDMVMDAQNAGLKYGFHHFKISPDKEITRDEAFTDFQAIAREYGFNLDDAVIVEHRKPRTIKENSPIHWHMIAPHMNPRTGRALDCRNSYKRNEKLSRLSEIRTGQKIGKGRHNRAVFHALNAEGKKQEAQAIQHITTEELPEASFSMNSQRKAERKGISLPTEKAKITAIWKASDDLKAFLAGLHDAGLTFKAGDKKETFIIEREGVLIGAVNRLLKIKKADFLTAYNNIKEEDLKNVQLDEITKPAPKGIGLIKKAKAKDPDEYDTPESDEPDYFAEQFRAEPQDNTLQRDIEGGDFSTSGNEPDFGIDTENTNGRAEPDRIITGDIKSNLEQSARADKSTFSHSELAITSAKINAQFNHKIVLVDIAHNRPITPEYIDEIKERLKTIKSDDKEYFSGVYANLKEQNREIYKYNKTLDNDAIMLIIDAFCRLLFGYTLYKSKTIPLPVDYPRIESPVDKDTFDSMKSKDQKTIVFHAIVQFRASYRRHENFSKKFELPSDFSNFQSFLKKYEGDFMAEEMINMFPDVYIRELSKSENKIEKQVAEELKKIRNGQESKYTEYNAKDLKDCIETVAGEIQNSIENKRLDEQLARDVAQFYESYGDNITAIEKPKPDSNIIAIENNFKI